MGQKQLQPPLNPPHNPQYNPTCNPQYNPTPNPTPNSTSPPLKLDPTLNASQRTTYIEEWIKAGGKIGEREQNLIVNYLCCGLDEATSGATSGATSSSTPIPHPTSGATFSAVSASTPSSTSTSTSNSTSTSTPSSTPTSNPNLPPTSLLPTPYLHKSPVQQKTIFLTGPSYKPDPKLCSLEQLLESPTFNETNQPFASPIHYRLPKPNLQRDTIPADKQWMFEDLWARIDELEDRIRRGSEPPSETSLPNTQPFTQLPAQTTTTPLWKQKKLLVQLRKEQYMLKDFSNPPLQHHNPTQPHYRGTQFGEIELGTDYVGFGPLGLWREGSKVFEKPWMRQAAHEGTQTKLVVSFEDVEHLRALVVMERDVMDVVRGKNGGLGDAESPLGQVYQTLEYYLKKAHLTPVHGKIVELKRAGVKNEDIARQLQEEFGVTHSDAYISTMYKRALEQIAGAATIHKETFENRGVPMRFKQCKDCGEILLKDGRNFTKSSRSRDNWNCRCKWCEREKRKK